jgi:hypothetical protein
MSEQLRKSGPIGKSGSQSGVVASDNKMLANVTARESAAHNSAANVQTKHVTTHKAFGELGGKGHGGSM